MKTTLSIKQRFDNFSKRIKPSEKHFAAATEQADFMIEQLHDKVSADGSFTLKKVLKAGSNAKHTSLLRTLENAFDVDLGAYYSGAGASTKELATLLQFTYDRLVEIYPRKDAEKDFEILTSAVRVHFASNVRFWIDVAPIVADDSLKIDNGGYIPRDDGEWRLTSVTAHNDFVRSRTQASKKRAGPVHFNRLVRMMKWWNNLQGDLAQPSILVELVAAAAVRSIGGVTEDWQTSLRSVFKYIATDRFATAIMFDDYYQPEHIAVPKDTVVILDSVNAKNNVARSWTKTTRDAYSDAAHEAYDLAMEANSAEIDGAIEESVDLWAEIFGDRFYDLSEDES